MNTKNNKRRRESVEKMEKAFVELLQSEDINQITVSDICKMTGLNRSTFYANYLDIYDFAEKLKEKLENDFSDEFSKYGEQADALKMFQHIKDNQIFYKTYFKLCDVIRKEIAVYDAKRAEKEFGNKYIRYHIEFFRSGLNAIIKMWLADGCKETPEEMAEIIKQEYRGREV